MGIQYQHNIIIIIKIQQQLKSTNDTPKERQRHGLTETQICSILNIEYNTVISTAI